MMFLIGLRKVAANNLSLPTHEVCHRLIRCPIGEADVSCLELVAVAIYSTVD